MILGLADLLHHTIAHHHDHVGDAHGLLLIVGDKHGGDAGLPLDAADLLPGLEAQPRVQIGQRLVQKQHAGALYQCPGNGYPLLLSAGQLTGLAVHQPLQLHQLCRGQCPLRHLCFGELVRTPQVFQREHDVLPYRQVGVQRVVLEHQPHAAILRRQMGHIVLTKEDLACSRLQQAADKVQCCALAAAGGTQQADELSVGDLKGKIVDGDDIAARFLVAVGELLGQMLQRDLHGSFSCILAAPSHGTGGDCNDRTIVPQFTA